MFRIESSVCGAAAALWLLVAPVGAHAGETTIELEGAVGLISPIDGSVVQPLVDAGVIQLAPASATLVWERLTPGVEDPMSGKTVYDFAVVDMSVQIDQYTIAHSPGFPIDDDQNTVIVGDDKEAIADATIVDSILSFSGGMETPVILSLDPPDDEGVSVAIGFQGDTSILSNQSLVVDQQALDDFLATGAIEMQIGTMKGFIRVGFTEATLVPEPAPVLLLAAGAAVLGGVTSLRRRQPVRAGASRR